ncbi:MAG: lamin tail domain-containing protein, partial [Verrucomicrobiota bacterium]
TEFIANNRSGLADEDGHFEDWIELANLGNLPVNLGGWHLTDTPGHLTLWTFPATNLSAGAYLVVFASGEDRRTPGRNLHTNFKLADAGEYLALVEPDGRTIATEFAPAFARQIPDVSFGFGLRQDSVVLIETNAPGRVSVPRDGALGIDWTAPQFDDSTWRAATNGIGYDTGATDGLESAYAAQVLQSQPVLYWRLDENSGQAAANAGSYADTADGSYQGDPVLGGAGPLPPQFGGFEPANLAPQFDGIDDFVGGPADLLSDLASFTMAGWIRPTVMQVARTGLWGQNDAVEFGFISGSTIQLWTPVGGIEAPYSYPLNEWHHVAAVGTGQQLQIYYDGNLVAAAPAGGGNYGSSSFNFNVGGGGVFDESSNHFKGQIDEVAVWRRALEDTEISQLLHNTSTAPVDFHPAIATDLQTEMFQSNSSAYLRVPFHVADPSAIGRLVLRLKYDDGFVAYLNGMEIARKNAPETSVWNSSATARQADSQAVLFEHFDVSRGLGALTAGANLLAIHGLNIHATNTDFLIQAQLVATSYGALAAEPRYFVDPTPGAPNGTGVADLGPILRDVMHTPAVPLDSESLVVTARVSTAFSAVSGVTLRYRVMFGTETSVAMNDQGVNGDAAAGDGIWTGVIPASAAAPGQMIRYYVSASDAIGHLSRWPIFVDPADSEEYNGTVVADPGMQSALAVVHLFIENPGGADTFGGTRCAVFHVGELYDSARISLHGQSSSGFPKKSYNLDFTADHRFRYRIGSGRVKDLHLMTNWGDKSRVRNALAYDMIAAAGSDGHFSFQVRVQRNAQFFSVADLMEDGDDRWLERLGRDPNGALYKIYNNLGGAGGNEKKTRKQEGFGDLQALINGLDPARSLSQRVIYACDNLDLPQTISYFVGMALVSSQDHGHKNFYVYRDSERSGEWTIFPWDVDLTWGRNWLDAQGYFTDTLFQNNVLNFYNPAQQGKPSNRLYDLIFTHPDFRRMYLRRLRTIMDTVLQPPGTPPSDLRIEARIREMMDRMDPPDVGTSDADLDFAKWGTWGNGNAMRAEATRILTTHLPGRRTFLFTQNPQLNGEGIPPSQSANASVVFGQVELNPASGIQAQEFIQLTNPNPYAVDISGWRLGDAVQFTFRPGTVIPAANSLYVSPDVVAFRARTSGPRGGQGLLVQGNYRGQLNAWGETLKLSDDSGRVVATNQFRGDPSPVQRYLRITEIMYNPVSQGAGDARLGEYLELKNIGPVALDLRGIRLTSGVFFDFSAGSITNLAAGEGILIVKDFVAFTARYGSGFQIAGQFVGSLDSAGEVLRLEDAAGEKVLEFSYDNRWYPTTDGLGFSLVVRDESALWSAWGEKENWRSSAQRNGSPGQPDPAPPAIPAILVNEVLTHTDPPEQDAIEIFNPTSGAVDLGGWLLTDDFFTPRKFRMAQGTTIPAGGYLVFEESQFNPPPYDPPAFALSSTGDQVFLFSADANTNLTGYWHGFDFGAAPNGVSFGLYFDNQAEPHFVAQSTTTL